MLFGFLSTLLNLLELVPPPTHFAVVFDARGKTFRCGWGARCVMCYPAVSLGL